MGFNEKLWADTRRNTEELSQLNVERLLKPTQYKLMASPPTDTLSASGAITSYATPTEYKAIVSALVSPFFKYSNGTVVKAGVNFPLDTYVVGNYITKPNNAGNFTIEFIHAGTSFEIKELGAGGKYRIFIDNGSGYELETLAYKNGAIANGSLYLRKIDFTTYGVRKIKIETYSYKFGGVIVNATDSIASVNSEHKAKCVCLGDSFTEGTGANWLYDGFAHTIGKDLSVDMFASGVGGTGYISESTGGKTNFIGRVQTDLIDLKPDYAIIAGGINDTSVANSLYTASKLLFSTIKTGSPNTKIFVVGNFYPKTPTAPELAKTEELRLACVESGIPFIDVLNGKTYNSSGELLINHNKAYVFGSGRVGALTNDGNADVMTSSDTTHPTQNGHDYLGKRISAEIKRIIQS